MGEHLIRKHEYHCLKKVYKLEYIKLFTTPHYLISLTRQKLMKRPERDGKEHQVFFMDSPFMRGYLQM
jgi:hypothetical protein